jgi:hypothetical protein
LSSQEPATDPCSEPDESSAELLILFSLRPILIFFSYLCLVLLIGVFPLDFSAKILYAFPICATCLACLTLHDWIVLVIF